MLAAISIRVARWPSVEEATWRALEVQSAIIPSMILSRWELYSGLLWRTGGIAMGLGARLGVLGTLSTSIGPLVGGELTFIGDELSRLGLLARVGVLGKLSTSMDSFSGEETMSGPGEFGVDLNTSMSRLRVLLLLLEPKPEVEMPGLLGSSSRFSSLSLDGLDERGRFPVPPSLG
jgi:hypothetical protein